MRRKRAEALAFVYRAEAISLRIDEVRERADAASARRDVDTLEACVAEAQLLAANMRELRLEQIASAFEG